MPARYRFGHAWHVDAAPERVRALLEDVARYDAWWPAVRVVGGAAGTDPGSGARAARLVVTAPLGHRLRIRVVEAAPRDRELRAAIHGDLEGWCAWRVEPDGDGSLVRFAQHVEARASLVRLATPLLRRVLERQHAAVMRAAADGMRAALAP
ncbi:SRPBCC family protein [Agrococcus terreus]|uniref:Polyketide cyclase n=1 Tax=Agrococcus terreus TaxID=574649 RepID=A0ABQ2KAN7_9MICO|nr:SRPBCC family protein [Agrococcus terreus]GGN77604.1 polyketide cyclase [Agrococcus terreus]